MKELTPSDYLTQKAAGTEMLLIDVRETSEWDAGHLNDAINIPMALLPLKIEEVAPNKDQKIVLHCERGGRSSQSVLTLEKMGYTDVSNFAGGYQAAPDEMKA